MAKKYIFIDRGCIEANKRNPKPLPVILIWDGKRKIRTHSVGILGPSVTVYSPNESMLECDDVRLAIVTEAELEYEEWRQE